MGMPAVLISSLILTSSQKLVRCLMLPVQIGHFSWNILQSVLLTSCISLFYSFFNVYQCMYATLGQNVTDYKNILKFLWSSLLSSVFICAICVLNLDLTRFLWISSPTQNPFFYLLLLSASFPLYFACSLLNTS